MTVESPSHRRETRRVQDLLDRGEYLAAYDLAIEELQGRPGSRELQYLAVLALARSGATERADDRLRSFGLADADESVGPGALAQDIAALQARVAKDRALTTLSSGPARARLAAVAATAYEAVFDRFHGSYPCINAATMWLLAGDRERAAGLAGQALAICRPDALDPEDYWGAATAAEAALLLADVGLATEALARADQASIGSYAARATTRHQLELISAAQGLDPQLLAVLANPRVIHYVGHRVAPDSSYDSSHDRSHDTSPGGSADRAAAGPGVRFAASDEARVAAEIRDRLDELGVGFGYGSLASGADILFAEALLRRQAEVHVVLPFERDQFVAVSVADSGPGWADRFDACLARATSVRLASDGQYLGDPVMFDFCSRVAMGEAILRAGALGSAVDQVAVWDGHGAEGHQVTGTAVDVARWRDLGRSTVVVAPRGSRGSGPAPDGGPVETDRPSALGPAGPRSVRALLFADIAGFSTLDDQQIPVFMDEVMGSLGAVINEFDDDLIIRQTWGDGLYLVLRDVAPAAACALAMQQAIRQLDLAGLGLDTLRGLRVGGHVGPVFEGRDRVRDEPAVFGANVTRAARIEPRTPEGEVYVTHSFAALAALERDAPWSCQYVGHVPTAKDYGVLPMYVLKPRRPGSR